MFKFCRTMKRKNSYRGGKQQIKATVVQQFRYNDPESQSLPCTCKDNHDIIHVYIKGAQKE